MPAESSNDIPKEPPAQSREEASPQAQDAAAPSLENRAELQKLQEENKQLTDQLLRKQAELENFRKRTEKEKQEFLQYSLFDAVKSLLPILDGFELAMGANGGGEEYRKGIALIHLQLVKALQKLGLKRLDTHGQPFDPRLHEAVATLETDQHPDHQIVEELQPGYSFKDRLLRPAMVTVAKRASGNIQEKNIGSE